MLCPPPHSEESGHMLCVVHMRSGVLMVVVISNVRLECKVSVKLLQVLVNLILRRLFAFVELY